MNQGSEKVTENGELVAESGEVVSLATEKDQVSCAPVPPPRLPTQAWQQRRSSHSSTEVRTQLRLKALNPMSLDMLPWLDMLPRTVPGSPHGSVCFLLVG